MTQVLLVKDKWDTYVVANDKGVAWAALDLLKKRVDEGFWYDDEVQLEAEAIVAGADDDSAYMALDFLESRTHCEYEYVEVQYTQVS